MYWFSTPLLLMSAIFVAKFSDVVGQPRDGGARLQLTDTIAIQKLFDRIEPLWSRSPDSLIVLSRRGLEASQLLDYQPGIMRSFKNIGIGLVQKGQYAAALDTLETGLELARSMGNTYQEQNFLSNQSMAFIAMGMYDEALANLLKALDILEQLDAKEGLPQVLNNLGMVYHYQGKRDQALNYYRQSVEAMLATGDSSNLTFLYGNIGHILLAKGKHQEAGEHYLKSKALADRTNNLKAIGNAEQSLGAYYSEMGDYQRALRYYLDAKTTLETVGEQTEYLRLLDNLSEFYLTIKDRDNAIHYATQCLSLAKQQGQLYYVQEAALRLSKLFESKGDYGVSLGYLQTAGAARDSLSRSDMKERLTRMEEQYRYNKRSLEARALHEQEIDRQEDRLAIIVGGLVMASVLLVVLMLGYRRQRKLNELLVDAHSVVAEKNQSLEKEDTFKNRLISILAHDVRSPIAALRLLIHNFDIDAVTDPKMRRRLIETSRHEVDSVAQFIDEILIWVQIQKESFKIEQRVFDLHEIVSTIGDFYKIRAKQRGIQLTVDNISPETWVLGDRQIIKVILRNLCDNAISHSSPGDTVHIMSQQSTTEATFRVGVADTGGGLSEEVKRAIRSNQQLPAYRHEEHLTVKGLGLSLCLDCATHHGLTLEVDDNQPKGTVFWFTLQHYSDTLEDEESFTGQIAEDSPVG